MHRASVCFGASGGFTFGAFIEALRSPSMAGWLTFGGSLLSTLAGLWISDRARRARLYSEQARYARDADRDRKLLEALEELAGVKDKG